MIFFFNRPSVFDRTTTGFEWIAPRSTATSNTRRNVSTARLTLVAEFPRIARFAPGAVKFVPSALNRLAQSVIAMWVTWDGFIASSPGQVFLTFLRATSRAEIEAGFSSALAFARSS
ncbi:MAG: hypothetical protein ABIZ81_01760 [Opitutaceae bacterium]